MFFKGMGRGMGRIYRGALEFTSSTKRGRTRKPLGVREAQVSGRLHGAQIFAAIISIESRRDILLDLQTAA